MMKTFTFELPQRLGQSIMRKTKQSVKANTLPSEKGYSSRKFLSLFLILFLVAGNAWGQDVVWDFSNRTAMSFANAKSYSFLATDNTTEMRYSAGSSDAIVAKSGSKSGYLKENGKTGNGTVYDIDGTTNIKKNRLIRLYVNGKGKLTINCNGTNGKYNVFDGAADSTSLVSGLEANESSDEITVANFLWIETATKGYITSIVWSPSAQTCAAPTSVAVAGEWDKFGGETISLTATATGGTGEYAYQWQKKMGDAWENVANTSTATTSNLVYENCDGSHSGTYRCVVSTGADCSTASDGFQVKVYTLECYTNGTYIYHFTREGSTKKGTLTLNLNANTAYKFKVHVDNDYYGNGGTINKDETNWVLDAELGTPDLTVNSGLGGTFTFTIDYSTSGNSNTLGVPEISVTYPRKTIYLNPGVWNADGAKYAIYYFIDESNKGWSDLLVGDACGTYTTIPQWNGVTMIAVRLNSDATSGTWDKKWNQTDNIAVTNNDYITITGWGDNSGNSPHTYSTYTPATYSITFNANEGTGTTASVTNIACGSNATLTANAFTRTGYTFAGWATATDGEVAHADKATISNITSNITLYAKWTINQYTVTWNPDGGNWGGNSENIVQTYEYGAKINAPEKPSRTGYEFVEWDPAYVVDVTTMPAENVTYTAQWTAEVYNITYYEAIGDAQIGDLKVITIAEAPITYRITDAVTLPALPAKDGYTATGWYSHWCVFEDTENTQSWAGCTPTTGHPAGYYGHANYIVKYTQDVPEPTTYTVTVTPPTNGTISASKTTGINEGETITLTVTPASGYQLETLTVKDASDNTVTVTDNKFTMPASNVTISATFIAVPAGGDCEKMVIFDGSKMSKAPSTSGSVTGASWNTTGTGTDIDSQAQSYNEVTYKGWKALTGKTSNSRYISIVIDEGYNATLHLKAYATSTGRSIFVSKGSVSSSTGDALTGTELNFTTSKIIQETTIEVAAGTYFICSTNAVHIAELSMDVCPTSVSPCTTPTITFNNGTYTVGSPALDLTTLFNSNSTGAVTYTVTNANGTGATIDGTSFTATTAGTATVKATQVANGGYCAKEVTATITVSEATPTPDNCGISDCGNATLTYTINASTETTNTADNLLSSAAASNATALEVNNKAIFSNITASEAGKAAAATNACFNPAPVMSSKLSMKNGNSYDASYYVQFEFTVKSGYAFTPCDVQFVVQPVSSAANFHWAITDGTTVYASGSETDVPVGKDNGATAITGLTSPVKMIAGTYYIRLYPYDNEGNTFRISNDVILKGTVEEDDTPTYTVTYNLGGGTGTLPTQEAIIEGRTFTLAASTGFAKDGYIFTGWNDGTTTYAAGDTYTMPAQNVTLTAQWKEVEKYTVTHTLSNVTATAGATGAEAATEGAAYAATFEAATGFVLPNTINVTIGGATQAAGTGYTWNPETGVLNIPADKVKGDIVITIAGQVKAPELICEELFYAKANSKSTFATTVGTIIDSNLGDGYELSDVDGFEFSVKPDNSSNSLTISPKDGYDFQAGDIITVWLYNSNSNAKAMGISLKSNGTKTVSVPTKTLQSLTVTLKKGDITTSDGNTTIVIGRNSSDARWVAVQVERCVEESCTEPSTILAITADPVTVQASQTAAISVAGGNEGPIAFTVTPAMGAVTGNDGAYSFSATEVGDYVINATQADFNGVCGGNATCVISVTAIGSLTEPTITATDLNENTADAFTFCETDNDDALKVVATSPEEGVTYAYQWYVKETDSNVFTAITGATEAIYPPTMDGIYYCEVTAKKPGYASASANSKEWTITITQSTAIISQPTSVALEGGQATLEVEAEGENLQYQWYSCEDDNRTNPETITGATNSTYTATAEGYYYVVVHSDCGVDRTSDVVEVTKEVEYCFNMTDLIKAKKTTIDSQSEFTSTHATITGGTVLYDRVAGETMELSENGLKFNSNSDYLKVTLKESALANGTVIEFTYYVGSTGRGIKILKSDKTTEICSNAKTGTSGTATYSFTITEEMQEEVFYITRVGGTAYLQSLRVSNCGAVCSDNTPTLSASTTNISASTSVTLTASNYTNGATLSFYKEGVADPLQTGAGNTCTVTVDVTSTFYVVAVNDCERRSSSVTVTFTCATPQPKIIQVGGVLGCNETVTLKAVTQEGTDITEGTLQWYKNGVAIDGANATTLELDLDDAGEYTVSLTDGCMVMSTNTVVVSNEVPEPELEVLAPRQYYQLNHDYTEEQQLRYLMKLTLPEGTDVAGATDGAYQITATLEENTLEATQFVENKIEDGVYWIMLNLNSLTANADTYGLAAGDIISIKVTPLNLCGEYPAELARTVEVKVTDKPTLAFIVSGADGNGTKEKKSHKVNGDFLTGYNKADLCLQTGTTSFDNTQELPLYTYLKEYFEVVPVNGYAPYNYYNYDPFDIALLTDFPKTKAGVGNDTLISAANLNALADLVDRKPLLSLKTHMVNTALGAWSEKGFIENPLTTKNQVNMTLLCHAHEMFKEDISTAPDNEGNVQVDILTQVGFDANKGMQGFRALASTNFINIATTVNSADNTNLVACCERQANVQARMLLLSINADATSFISDNGKIVIRNALHYLLQTDPTHVSDCSIVFDNGGGVGRTVTLKGKTYTSGDNEWGNPANWSTSTLPNQANNVLIEANCQVTNVHSQTGVGVYGVANVRINENYTLTIAPTGGIVSTGLFAVYKPGEKYNAIQITDPKYITVQASETNTGLLMHSHQETLHATVQMYSPANHDKEGGYNTAGFHKVKNYTDVAVPVEVDATFFQNNGHEAQYWKWNEKGTVGFERQTTGTVPHFQGGCISHCDPQLFSFAGQVALAKDHPFEMTYSEGGWYGINVVGNSWTAPIQILELTTADFGSNLEQTIYIYNTGHDATAGTGVASQADFSTPGQWMAIPIETAKTGEWAGPKVIPAMQAFQVLTLYPLVTPADGETQAESQTLTIGYNKHIRCRGAVNGLTQKLYAPQRPKKAPRTGLPSTAEVLMPDPNKVDTFVTPTMLRVMFVADSVKTDVYLFEDDQRFKNGFDNGWDGTYQNDETVSGAYVLTEAGNMAISAQPYLEGTTVALKSKKTTTFQCTFKYTGTETLYLNDTKLEQSTKIEEGASYVFMASPEDAPNRFVISAEPYQGSITGMAGVVMVDNALVVNNPLQEPLRVFIYDAVGRTHHVYDTKAAMEEINLPNVPGVYLIRVKGENTDLVHKVVR